jgi:hypothetical protein
MTDHVKTLQAARGNLVASRRELAKELSKPKIGSAKAAKLRADFIEVQHTIGEIDNAIAEERKLAPPAAAKKTSSDDRYEDLSEYGDKGYA